ncbi:hypothetical protein GCM10009760_03360 [Kitasatospora kazusensis]|uniref:Glycosyltransferase RgtA/B/C/D-like domain-containing protein n=1 Tax=Kitasatospora kazusensis TaxID=407974 RepID=A0ABN2YPQ3_9ACTN
MTVLLDRPALGSPLRTRLTRRVPPRLQLPLAVGLGTQAVLLLWWAAFYPGLTSYDSAVYVSQVTTDTWSSEHSVLYDALLWATLQLPGKLALLTLGQTVLTAATLAYTCVCLRALGCRGRWTAPIALLLAMVPQTGAFVVFIWKDVPFTLCSVLVFAASARLVARRAGPLDWWVLGVALLGLGLFRNNGPGVALVAGLALVAVVRGFRRRLLVLTLASVAVSLFGQLWLYPALGIRQPALSSVYSLNYHDLAVAYAGQPDLFSPADTAVMAQVAPLAAWAKGGANCYVSDQLVLGAGFDLTAATRVNDELMGLWTKALEQRPDLVLDARLCRGHIAWSPFPGPDDQHAGTWIPYALPAPPDLYGVAAPGTSMARNPYRFTLYNHPVWQPLHTAAEFWYNAFRVPQLDWLFYRGATWCYLGYAALLLYAGRRRMRSVYALAGVMIGFQLTVLAANPAPLYRYMVGPLFIGPFCLALLPAVRGPRARNTEV